MDAIAQGCGVVAVSTEMPLAINFTLTYGNRKLLDTFDLVYGTRRALEDRKIDTLGWLSYYRTLL